MNALLFDSVLI